MWSMSSIVVAMSVVNVVSQTTENVAGICWFRPLGDSKDGWGILMATAIVYSVFFAAFLVAYRSWLLRGVGRAGKVARVPWYFSARHVQFAAAIGFFNCLNGIFVMYMTNHNRVPALTQQCVFNMGMVMTILINPCVLKASPKARLGRYTDWRALLGMTFVLGAGAIGIVHVLQQPGSSPESVTNQVLYSLLFLFGNVAGVLYNVLQSRYFAYHRHWEAQAPRYGAESAGILRGDASSAPRMSVVINHTERKANRKSSPSSAGYQALDRDGSASSNDSNISNNANGTNGANADQQQDDVVKATVVALPSASTSPDMYVKFNLLAWQTFFLCMFVTFFFWTDLIPWFGYSGPHWHEFKRRAGTTLAYSLFPWKWSMHGMGQAGWYQLLFNVGYIVSFVAATLLNDYSTTYTAVSNQLTPVFASLLFQFGDVCGVDETMSWSLLGPALVMGALGGWLFTWFEAVSDSQEEQSKPGILFAASK
eukprot:TRINITY_DN68091_c1_g1_i1.p1 TRINITY_DN68091_c1_g1~~TRINITY_DN68091_c1_g1_i1.p1  ORF type:complete len:480 (-),score=208.43 TRINITY_DN68091_c1_g1_i1:1282-2721(-)